MDGCKTNPTILLIPSEDWTMTAQSKTSRRWSTEEDELLVSLVFCRFMQHGDLYPTTDETLREINYKKHIWVKGDDIDGIATFSGRITAQIICWIVIARAYAALASDILQRDVRTRKPSSLQNRWLHLRTVYGVNSESSQLYRFVPRLTIELVWID